MSTSPVNPSSRTPSSQPGSVPAAQEAPSLPRRMANAAKRALTALGQFFSRPSARQVNDSLENAVDEQYPRPASQQPSTHEEDDDELSALSPHLSTTSFRNTPQTPTHSNEDDRSSKASTASTGSRSPSPAPSDISSIDEDTLEAAQKTREENEIKRLSTIANVQMTFTMEVNGKKVTITPEILTQLQPIFEELAKTPEVRDNLSKGFALVIDLEKLSNIHFYQNKKEILEDACATLFQNNPGLLKNVQNLEKAIKISEHFNPPSSTKKKPKKRLILKATPSAHPDYIHKVLPDGDCLLESALFHIKKQDDDAALTAANIRKAMAQKIRDQNALREKDKGLILQDILDARNHATQKNISQMLPHSYLFSETPNGLDFLCAPENIAMDRSKDQWNVLLNAYADYISHNIDSSDTRPSLGGYTMEYLNQKYFQNKPLLVVRETDGSFKGDREVSEDDQANTPVILYDGNHYDAIDSSKKEFWKKYKCTKQSD